jgi:disulfide bond formation protein DsbB
MTTRLQPAAEPADGGAAGRYFLGSALAVALVALAGSLWLSLGMNLKACPLCFYQRTFVMGVVAILAIGRLSGPRHRAVLPLLSLPLSVAAFATALFHVRLELTGRLECPAGVLGLGTAPQQSAAITALLLALLLLGSWRARRAGEPVSAALAGVVLGASLSWGAIASAPPAPAPPAAAYAVPLETCRPPYVPR